MKTIVLVLIISTMAVADEISSCKCEKGYVPQKDEAGVVSCYGSILKSNEKSILPCNIVVKPPCKCKEEATSIIQDSTGTWCSKAVDGKEDKRWQCENKEEWAAFYIAHPDEKP